MKILNIKAENIKKLVAVDITPTDNTVVITGKNGAGKSSILDAIFWALGGAKNIQDEPIRQGQDHAFVKLDLGKLKVERTFTSNGTYLKVTAEDGAKYGNGQEMLNNLLGAITFDPLEFARMDSKKQYATLSKLVAPDLDIEELDKRNAEFYARRTEVNRQIKELEGSVKELGGQLMVSPPEKIVVSELVEKINAANARATQFAQVEGEQARLNSKAESLEKEIERLKAEREEIIVRRSQVAQELTSLAEQMQDDKIGQWSERVKEAEDVNAKVESDIRARDRLAAKTEELTKAKDLSEKLTKAMEDRAEKIKTAVASAKLPVEGLSLENGAVQFQGVPFTQASSAEQIRVSTAIAMAMNPELRVIRIKDGSLLDDNGLDMIKAMAQDEDFQVWIEVVQSDDPVAIMIEDGMVKGAPAPAESDTGTTEKSSVVEKTEAAAVGQTGKAKQGNLI